jgi:uncharacterized RDD family membrane protein YckC
MKCPECESSEIDQTGTCPSCGFHSDPHPAGQERQTKAAAAVAGAEEHQPLPQQQELPQWRIELSRRLQEIKEKRGGKGPDPVLPLPFPQSEAAPPKPEEPASRPSRRAAAANKVRKSAERARASVQAASDEPPAAALQAKAAEGSPAGSMADVSLRPAAAQAASSGEVRHLIDDLVSMHAGKPEPAPAPVMDAVEEESGSEARLVLLSRTLSGIIDMLAVFICTVGFVLAEDVFSGLEFFDLTSFIDAGLVFFATYFLYSLFFLGASNQTIGMMITRLRLVGMDGKRPALRRIIGRCVLYLPSVFLLGIGLLWGCFDREAMCLHDRFSGTRIEPLVV